MSGDHSRAEHKAVQCIIHAFRCIWDEMQVVLQMNRCWAYFLGSGEGNWRGLFVVRRSLLFVPDIEVLVGCVFWG